MRDLINLLPIEQKILKELVEFKRNSEAGIQNFQSGRVLEQSARFNFAAIKWDKDGNKPIRIYYEEKKNEEGFYTNLFILYDYLLFLEELEKERLIVILPAKLEEEQEKERILFNRKKYNNKEVFNSWQLNDSINGFVFWDNSRKEYKSWIDIVSYLEKYVYLKIIYPTSVLESFVKNGFKTEEQIRHDEEMDNLKKQLKSTRWSAFFAFATLLVTSLLGIWQRCSSTRIESQELESIAKSFQYMNSSQSPEITTIVSDTITTIDTLSSDSCKNTTPSKTNSPDPIKQGKPVAVVLHKDTSCIITTAPTTDTVIIQSKKQ